jgi:hypothetical protein
MKRVGFNGYNRPNSKFWDTEITFLRMKNTLS